MLGGPSHQFFSVPIPGVNSTLAVMSLFDLRVSSFNVKGSNIQLVSCPHCIITRLWMFLLPLCDIENAIHFSVKIMNFLLCFFSFTYLPCDPASHLVTRTFSFKQKVGLRFSCHCPKQQTNDSINHFYVNIYVIALGP
jgi:hypothetical protein